MRGYVGAWERGREVNLLRVMRHLTIPENWSSFLELDYLLEYTILDEST